MLYELNETHDPALRSWVETANLPTTDFPVQNLPFGVFRCQGESTSGRIGVAIGDQVLDLAECARSRLLDGLPAGTQEACQASMLNPLMALGHSAWSALRHHLSQLLRTGSARAAPIARRQDRLLAAASCLVPADECEMLLPAAIGDYTDFYASLHHATNVGSMFRPDNPLLPNYKYVPIAYHGRASSIVGSGTGIRRPMGQFPAEGTQPPGFGSSRALDYELEVGFLVGPGNVLGEPVPVERAEERVFGLCLVNDWSARDIQRWEYQPLGPFLSKSFATTVSPWVVTLEALAPYRARAFERPPGDPAPLAYLYSERDQEAGGIDLTLEVFLRSRKMREQALAPFRLSCGNLQKMYWTVAQMLAHHTSNGCNLRPGDLLASGTVSGPDKLNRGCLLELTWRGSEPVALPSGEQRRFLEDGDEVIFRGWCTRSGYARIGFGECRGTIFPASGS